PLPAGRPDSGLGDRDVPVPAAATGLRAWDVHDADPGLAADRRSDRRDAVFHRLERSDQTRHVSTAAADSRDTPLMGGLTDGRMGRCVQALLIAIAISSVDRVSAQTADQPIRPSAHQTIDTVIIENGNIFDRADAAPGWVAHLANRLH